MKCGSANFLSGRHQVDITIFWMIFAMSPIGFFLGLRYKIGSLIASCSVVVATMALLAIHSGWAPLTAAFAIIATTATLQGAYWVGLIISAKARSRQHRLNQKK